MPVLIAALVAAIFSANDALDVIGADGRLDKWAFFAAFLIFVVMVIWPLLQLDARLDERERWKGAIEELTPFIVDGNRVLEQCGRPEAIHNPVDPMLWQTHCMPMINDWHFKAQRAVESQAPEYRGKFENDGDVYHDTDKKPAMVQQLEGRVRRLDEIVDNLRAKL
jgi:hypothetical protein